MRADNMFSADFFLSEARVRKWRDVGMGRGGDEREGKGLTDSGIVEDDQEARIVDPLDLETTVCVLPLGEDSLDISGFEFLWEACEREDTSYAGRELRKRSCHCEKRVGDARRKRVGLDGEAYQRVRRKRI